MKKSSRNTIFAHFYDNSLKCGIVVCNLRQLFEILIFQLDCLFRFFNKTYEKKLKNLLQKCPSQKNPLKIHKKNSQ